MKGEIIAGTVIVVFFALFIYVAGTNTGAEWGGADGEAEGVIEELTGGTYEPWFEPIMEPPSGEIESLLFSFQAVIGAIVIGYFFGYYRGKQSA
jgi:cobalt/nickel transport protein